MKNLIFLFVCIAVIPTLLGGCTQTPQQPEFDDPLFQRMYSQMKTYSDERERTIANLLDGNCEEAYAGLKLDPQYPQEDLYRWAELHRTGLCADQNHELAFQYYQQAIEQNPHDGKSLSRISSAYSRGEGTALDTAKATYYARRAISVRASDIISDLGKYPGIKWDFFTDKLTADWEPGDALAKEIDWFKSQIAKGPKPLIEFAQTLWTGSAMFEQDKQSAFYLMRSISFTTESAEAFYYSAIWPSDNGLAIQIYGDIERAKQFNYMKVDGYFLRFAGEYGYIPAQKLIVQMLIDGPDYEHRNWSIYYWMLNLKRQGEPIDQDQFLAIRETLTPDEIKMLNNWPRPSQAEHRSSPFTAID